MRWPSSPEQVSKEKKAKRMSFSDLAEEVTQRHFCHTLWVKAVTSPSRFREGGGTPALDVRMLKNVEVKF